MVKYSQYFTRNHFRFHSLKWRWHQINEIEPKLKENQVSISASLSETFGFPSYWSVCKYCESLHESMHSAIFLPKNNTIGYKVENEREEIATHFIP